MPIVLRNVSSSNACCFRYQYRRFWFAMVRTPHHIIQAVKQEQILSLASEAMLDELKDVLHRPKFTSRLERISKTAQQIMDEYVAKVVVIEVEPLTEAVASDADDDKFLACALSGCAEVIVSGDPHLLELGSYKNISTQTAKDFLQSLG